MNENRKTMFLYVFLGAILGGFLASWTLVPTPSVDAATVTSGVAFTTNQVVQHTHLNNAINNATVSDIVSGDITDGTIAAADLAANSVTSVKILDATVTGSDIGSRTIAASNIQTNGVTEIELATNITLRAGTWNFTSATVTANSIASTAVSGTTTTAGAGDSGKIPKLDSDGKLADSMIRGSSLLSSNRASVVSSASGYTWTTVASLTTTATNGTVIISGRALAAVGDAGNTFLRIRDASSSVTASIAGTGLGGGNATPFSCTLTDSLSGSAKTYTFELANSGTSVTYTNAAATGVGGVSAQANHLGMTLIQNP